MVNSFTDLLRMDLSSLLCDPVTFLAMKSDLIRMCSVLIKVIVLVTIILIIRPSIDNFLVVNHDLFFSTGSLCDSRSQKQYNCL